MTSLPKVDDFTLKCVVCFQVFYKPMIKMNIMPYTQIHQLFPNLDALIQLHGKEAKSFF